MQQIVAFAALWALCSADDYYHFPTNATRSTVSGIAAYRSALTLDWLAGEDMRQRELVHAFETEATAQPRTQNMDCMVYSKPTSGKVARLMLELLKNLEGDEGELIPELIQALVKTKLLVETSMLDAEPDLDSLVHTPAVMMGEPHTTFPRILAMVWMLASDPVSTKKTGWCAVRRLNKYLMMARPIDIAQQMRALDYIVARARFIMEEFIQHVTPLNMYTETTRVIVRQHEKFEKYKSHDNLERRDNHMNPKFMQQLSESNKEKRAGTDIDAMSPPRDPPPELLSDFLEKDATQPDITEQVRANRGPGVKRTTLSLVILSLTIYM